MYFGVNGKIVGVGTAAEIPDPPPVRVVPPPPVKSPPRPGAQTPPSNTESSLADSMWFKIGVGVGVAALCVGFFAWMARRHGT